MTKHSKAIAAAAAAAAATLALGANANADMYLNIDGISGEYNKGDIEVLAWSWGLSQSGNAQTGPGKANFQDLSFTHYVDTSSVRLYEQVATGQSVPTATLFVRQEGLNPFVYLEIVMEDVLVTSASTGGSSGETRLTQNTSLNFGKITTKYKKDINSPFVEYCFDIVQNVSC